MRLEKIILNGFKSFADKTEFDFNSSVTAVVGPNGCGKSNVVDAVKWVLGEQSVKSLRSDQMADVIFGGSGSRKPLGAAEVSLLMSNTDGAGTGRLPIDADQVEISRRVLRSGESEYRINSKTCRLKDIRELFMDTGVGAKAYSIIEQGQIEQLVSASKVDRRAIFEEAAGISKYKAHKKETLRKLERTEQNLLRLADILSEVQKQLRSIKLQAGKARSYLQYTQRLKELQVTYSLVEYARNDTEWKTRKNALEQLQKHLEQITAEAAQNDALISKLGEQKIEAEHSLSRTDNVLVSVQSKIDQNLQKIEFLRSKIKEMQQRTQEAGKRIEELQEQKRILEENRAKHQHELTDCDRTLRQKNQAVEEITNLIRELDAKCTAIQADLEDDKSGIIDMVRRTSQLHNEIQSISVYRHNLASQKDRLAGQAQTARGELERLLTEKARFKARLSDIEKLLGELHHGLESKQKEIEQVEAVIAEDNKRLANSKETRSALNGEITILTDMEKRREGLSNGVQNILRNRSAENELPDYIEGVLAELIEADFQYAGAVEAALEGRTDSLIVNDTNKLLADSKTIEKLQGRVNFVCLDRIEPFADTMDFSKLPYVKGRLIEFVRYDDKYAPLIWQLLGRTIIVETVDAAVELAQKTPTGYEFVTLKGEFARSDGTVKLGPLGKATGLISRKSRLRQLQETADRITSEITVLEDNINKNNQTKTHIDKLCKDLRTAIYEANTEKMQVDSKLSIIEQNIQQLSQNQPLIASEIDSLEEQIAQSVQKEYDSKQKLQELETVSAQRTTRIKELEAQYAEQKTQLQSQAEQLTDLKVALGQAAEQAKALKQIIANLESQLQSNHTSAEAAKTEIENCRRHLTEDEREILSCEARVSELFVEKEANQQSSHRLLEQIKSLSEEQKRLEQLLSLKRAEQSETEQKTNQLMIELTQLDVRQQDLIERVRDELQIDLAEAYKSYVEKEVDWEQVRQEITELRSKIERLGNVNVDAIAEQESLEERNNFLSKQVEDLNTSKAQLQQLISRLNKKSRDKFRDTFEQVRVHFQQIFRKLFGGGRADVVLEDSEDILEAGIEVIARPPGKETRSISLLSGGEKSMTAIALLFAIFKTKPSPFCFLDEIDAALDEANNERFNLLLGDFVKDSQFIIITHSKRTMSIADVLVGITMQAQGVSKKISVRFDEYDEESAAA